MNEIPLKTKPILKIVCLFIAGLIFTFYIKIPINITFITTVFFTLTSIGVLCISKSQTKLLSYLVCLIIFLVAILRYQLASDILPKNHIVNFINLKKNLTIKGYVANYPVKKNNIISCYIATEKIHLNDSITVKTEGKILLKSKCLNLKLRKGDHVQITGKLKRPQGERNPGEFNYRKYLKEIGIYGIIYINHSSNIMRLSIEREGWLFNKLISNSREYLGRIINKAFDWQYRALLKGLILGERGEITPEIRNAFSRIGVMHVLAVSGLHVGFIVLIFTTLFNILRFPYRTNICLTMLSTLFYMFIVGFKPPVVRATIIVELYLWGVIIQRRSNPLNLLATAALIILIINPLQLFQSSFQLSFVAVLSIFYLYRILNNYLLNITLIKRITKTKIGNYIWQLFLVSFAVSCGTLPLTIYYFEMLPIFGIFINVIVIPLVGVIIAVGFLYISLASIIWPIANLVASINIFLLNLLIGLITKTAKLPFAYVPIHGINLGYILLIYLILLLIFNLQKKRSQKALIFIVIIGLNVFVWRETTQKSKWLEVVFFDVGDGDAALVKLPDDKHILIDGGNFTENFNAGKRHIVPYLRRRGIKKVDVVIPSHADADHLGGIPYILRNIKVDRVIDNGKKANSTLFLDFKFLIDSLQINHEILKAGNRVSGFKNIRIFVFHPSGEDKFDDHNNSSLVLKIIYGDISFLFTGDIEHEAEKELLKFGELIKSDVLKVPHHGSNTSSTLDFLKIVKPKYAVISVGEYNRFNHPSRRVLQRLNYLDIETIRTDNNGAVIFRTDGKRLERIR